MRICLHTVRDLSPDFIGGTERLLVEIANELIVLGHEPFIIASGIRGEFKIGDVPVVHKLPSEYAREYLSAGRANSNFVINSIMKGEASEEGLRSLASFVDKQLQSVNFDALHLNSFASSLFSRFTSGAFVLNHENDREYDSKLGSGFTNYMADLVRKRIGTLHLAATLATPSHHYAKYFSNIFGIAVQPVKCGVCLTNFERQRRRRTYKKYNNSPLEILLPSRFEPHQKGHDIALKACLELKRQAIFARFTFTGLRSDYESRLAHFLELAQALDIKDRVRVRRLSDIRTAYDTCDIVVSPERYCSYGLSISEALSLGVPTVLSNIPTYREIGEGFDHAIFFESENHLDLAEKILTAHSLSLETCNNFAAKFRQENDLRKTTAKLLAYYEKS